MALAVTAVLGGVLARGFALGRAGTSGFWMVVVGSELAVCAVSTIWAVRADEWDYLLPRWGDMTRGFFAAAAVFGASFALVKLVIAGTPREQWVLRIYAQLGDPADLRDRFGRVCAIIFVASAAEEIVWRGFVTRLLEPAVGSRKAWIVSAALYATAHLPTLWVLETDSAGLNPALFGASIGVGFAMGALTRVCDGRVPPAIVAHTLFDIAATMMFRLVGNSV